MPLQDFITEIQKVWSTEVIRLMLLKGWKNISDGSPWIQVCIISYSSLLFTILRITIKNTNLGKIILKWLLNVFFWLILGKTCSVNFHLYIIPTSHSRIIKFIRCICIVLSCNKKKILNQLHVNLWVTNIQQEFSNEIKTGINNTVPSVYWSQIKSHFSHIVKHLKI